MSRQVIVQTDTFGEAWAKANENFIELYNLLDTNKISTELANAFAYLPSASTTIISAVDTWTPVGGTFTNSILENFIFDTDHIEYTGKETRYIKIIAFLSAQSDTSTTEVDVGIAINGTVGAGAEAKRLLKLTSDIGSWGLVYDIELKENDEIQLQVKCDKTCEITFETFQVNAFSPTSIYNSK